MSEWNNQPYRPAFTVPDPDSEFRDYTSIDVLHTFPLGVTRDVVTALETRYEAKMNKFFAEKKQRKKLGAQPGGKWSGPQMEILTSKESIKKLWRDLPNEDEANYLLYHLEACKELHRIVINPVLDPEYPLYIQNFRDTFDMCHDAGLLNETEKVHHVYAGRVVTEDWSNTMKQLDLAFNNVKPKEKSFVFD